MQAPLCPLHLCPRLPTLGQLSVTLAHPPWALFRWVCSTVIHTFVLSCLILLVIIISKQSTITLNDVFFFYVTPWLCQPLCMKVLTRAEGVWYLQSKRRTGVSQNCILVVFIWEEQRTSVSNKRSSPGWFYCMLFEVFLRGTFPSFAEAQVLLNLRFIGVLYICTQQKEKREGAINSWVAAEFLYNIQMYNKMEGRVCFNLFIFEKSLENESICRQHVVLYSWSTVNIDSAGGLYFAAAAGMWPTWDGQRGWLSRCSIEVRGNLKKRIIFPRIFVGIIWNGWKAVWNSLQLWKHGNVEMVTDRLLLQGSKRKHPEWKHDCHGMCST